MWQPQSACCAGVQRVALLDFDVHHGNGTEACVAACAPHTKRFGIKTPFSEGVQSFPVYRPWMGLEDSENILFARWAWQSSPAPAFGA